MNNQDLGITSQEFNEWTGAMPPTPPIQNVPANPPPQLAPPIQGFDYFPNQGFFYFLKFLFIYS
ncbi:MAG TPA: hypothetical protein VFP45_03470 [Candidatus Nitrosotalea sp.]|nr:hypothetical protein [Candidatus Nitrosotalea sp.]